MYYKYLFYGAAPSVLIMISQQIVGEQACFLQSSSFEVKVLKFLTFLGGFPLSICKKECENASSSSHIRFTSNKMALGLALVVVLLPGLVILTVLSIISIQWSIFAQIMGVSGYTFWDTLSIVSSDEPGTKRAENGH